MNLAERKAAFRAREEEFRRLGHDTFAAARFVAEAAGDLAGPALDVGTGRGLLAMALARRGLDVTSVDVDAEDSELAAALAGEAGLDGRIRSVLHDAGALPFPDGAFGSAAMMDVLHHLDDARPVLAEMARVVRPGGTIVVAEFVESGFDLVAAVHRAEGGEHPRSGSTMEGARQHLSSLGWREAGRAEAHHNVVAWFRKSNAVSAAIQDHYTSHFAHCYGCGRLNEHGHRFKSTWEGEDVVARFTPGPQHIALPGFVYGGLIASLIDCHGMATAAATAERSAGFAVGDREMPRFVTASLGVRYLKPTPLGRELELRARVRESTEKKAVVEVAVSVDGIVTVRGEVIAVRAPESMKPGGPAA